MDLRQDLAEYVLSKFVADPRRAETRVGRLSEYSLSYCQVFRTEHSQKPERPAIVRHLLEKVLDQLPVVLPVESDAAPASENDSADSVEKYIRAAIALLLDEDQLAQLYESWDFKVRFSRNPDESFADLTDCDSMTVRTVSETTNRDVLQRIEEFNRTEDERERRSIETMRVSADEIIKQLDDWSQS